MRGVLFAALVSLACSLLWAALPYTDAFTAADGTSLTAYSANWTMISQVAEIQGNAVSCESAVARCMAIDNTNTYGAQQIASAVVKNPTNNYYMGVLIHASVLDSGYQCRLDSNELVLFRYGTLSTLWTATTPTIQDGDVLSVWRDGTNVYCDLSRSGVSQYASGAISDNTWTDGSPGIAGFANSPTPSTTRLDDVTLNNYSAGGATPMRSRLVMMFFTLPEIQ